MNVGAILVRTQPPVTTEITLTSVSVMLLIRDTTVKNVCSFLLIILYIWVVLHRTIDSVLYIVIFKCDYFIILVLNPGIDKT